MKAKVCRDCKLSKSVEDFHIDNNNKGGRKNFCKTCSSARQKHNRQKSSSQVRARQRIYELRRYGLELQDYEALLVAQGGKCAICGLTGGDKNLSVDHCHNSGHVRGLLCQSCNTAIGLLQDNPELCQKASVYLEESWQTITAQ